MDAINLGGLAGILLPIAVVATVFTFVAVVSWVDSRRREREAYYRNEMLRTLAAQPGGADRVIEFLREADAGEQRRRRDTFRLGGVVCIAVGIGTGLLLWAMAPGRALYLGGAVPLLMGFAILYYARFMSGDVGVPPGSGDARPRS